MNRDAALRELDSARQEWEAAFERVPEGALRFLKAGDDYALGGLQVHVNWVLVHYRRVLDGIIRSRFGEVGPQDPPGAEARAIEGARQGIASEDRSRSLEEMARLHEAVRSTCERLPETDWGRKAAVVYGAGQQPYPTSPEDIVGWLTDHYREHVEQSADLTEDWKGSSPG